MANMNFILQLVRECLELGLDGALEDKAVECLVAVRNWIINNPSFESFADKYRFISMTVLSLYNEIIGKTIPANKTTILYGIIFELLQCIPTDAECQDQVSGISWAKITCKMSLRYAGVLISNRQFSRAKMCLEFVSKTVEQTLNKLDTAERSSTRNEFSHDLLICNLYALEMYAANENYLDARNTLVNVRDGFMTTFTEVDRKYLAALCFNVGLNSFEMERYEDCAFWMSNSFELDKLSSECRVSKLLLMAKSYLLLDPKIYFQAALDALCKADKENINFDVNILKLKAYVAGDVDFDNIRTALQNCCKTMENSEEKIYQIVHILQNCEKKSVFHEVMLMLESIPNITSIAHKVFEQHLSFLLKEQMVPEADAVIENYIGLIEREFHFSEAILSLIESQACLLKEKSIFVKAVCWFDYCIQIVSHCSEQLKTGSDQLNKLKFYQQKCCCLLELGWCNKANQMLLLCEEQSENHIINRYLKLMLCIIQNEEENAIQVIETFNSDSINDFEDIANILILCAEFGLRNSKIHTTLNIFENVIGKLSNPTHILTALKSIIKLKIQFQCSTGNKIEQDWVLDIASKVCSYLGLISKDEVWFENQARWFMKIFWNIAHNDKENPLLVHKLLYFCNKILRACNSSDSAILLQRCTCLLMSVAAGLEVIRSSTCQELNPKIMDNIFENIEEFKSLLVKSNSVGEAFRLSAALKSTQRLLLICEFEAKARIRSHDLEDVFERAISLPDIDGRTFELLAAIAYASGIHCYSLTLRSLKAAIGKELEKQHNYEQLCRLYRSLLCIILARMEKNCAYKVDFGKFINEVNDLVNSSPIGIFPQMELLWFITKIWNTSVKAYLQFGNNCEALTWAQIAIGMTKHLVSLREVYEEKMQSIYTQMLQK